MESRSDSKLSPGLNLKAVARADTESKVVVVNDDLQDDGHTKRAHEGHATTMNISSIDSPPEIYQHVVDAGAAKGQQSLNKSLSLGLLAGMYIGFGFALCMIAGGQMTTIRQTDPGLFNMLFGSFGFPMGLTLVVVAGADLFTSNCMYMVAAFAEGQCTLLQWLRVWVLSYLSNLCGALLLVQLMVSGEVFEGRSEFTVKLARTKTSHPFTVTFVRALLANMLVCLAVWQANAARDLWGKFIGIWLPISGFVALGLEHCIANMFLIPLSMKLGSGISVARFITHNLIPATLGNIVGGAGFVGVVYAVSYGAWDVEAAVRKAWAALLLKRRGAGGEFARRGTLEPYGQV